MSPSPGVVTVKAANPVISHTLIRLQEDMGGVRQRKIFFFNMMHLLDFLVFTEIATFSLDYGAC